MTYGVRICNLTPERGEGYGRDGKLYRWEFGEYIGPVFVGKNGDPLKNQPVRENYPCWKPFEEWFAQRKPKEKR